MKKRTRPIIKAIQEGKKEREQLKNRYFDWIINSFKYEKTNK